MPEPSIAHGHASSEKLSALDRERYVSVQEAAQLKNISEDTFRRHYAHIIRKVSPRRNAVKLGDLISED